MDGGELVPDDVVVRMLVDRLGSAGSGFILDGFPRNVAQAAALEGALGERGIDLDAVLSFDIDRKEVVRRISSRRTCPTCQRAYNMATSPPRDDEVCDVEATPLLQREDDREDVVRRRMEVYEEQTAPVRAFYDAEGLVRTIDADGSEDEVFARVVEALGDVVQVGEVSS
jgi:adenylate kinase